SQISWSGALFPLLVRTGNSSRCLQHHAPDFAGEGRNGNVFYFFPEEISAFDLRLEHAHVQAMVRDCVAALADSLERSRRQFREHGEFPHRLDALHEVLPLFAMNDSAQMNPHGCGTFPDSRNLPLHSSSERYACRLDRADQAAWRPE